MILLYFQYIQQSFFLHSTVSLLWTNVCSITMFPSLPASVLPHCTYCYLGWINSNVMLSGIAKQTFSLTVMGLLLRFKPFQLNIFFHSVVTDTAVSSDNTVPSLLVSGSTHKTYCHLCPDQLHHDVAIENGFWSL